MSQRLSPWSDPTLHEETSVKADLSASSVSPRNAAQLPRHDANRKSTCDSNGGSCVFTPHDGRLLACGHHEDALFTRPQRANTAPHRFIETFLLQEACQKFLTAAVQ